MSGLSAVEEKKSCVQVVNNCIIEGVCMMAEVGEGKICLNLEKVLLYEKYT